MDPEKVDYAARRDGDYYSNARESAGRPNEESLVQKTSTSSQQQTRPEASPRRHSLGPEKTLSLDRYPSPARPRGHTARSQQQQQQQQQQQNGAAVANGNDAKNSVLRPDGRRHLSLKDRVRHFTWTWFAMTMATGGIANVLNTIPEPYRFHGLYAIGCIFFLLNIVLFIFNVVMISLRFYFYPYTLWSSLTHPTESLFSPSLVISFGTILINITQYGATESRPWLTDVMHVMFWIDCALAIVCSAGIFLMIWSTTTYTIAQMTPVWIFPAYPLLIIGPHAGILAPKVAPSAALDIIIGGFVLQGIGFLVSLMVYSAFLYRLMTQKLPKQSTRPAMFISVGPSGFTISAIISMGQALPRVVPDDFMIDGAGELTGQISLVAANWVGLWLWGLALWFFLVSVGAHFSAATRGRMEFAMTWYSFVFPNTALTTATFAVARALDGNRSIEVLGCTMTVALVLVWLFVVAMMLRALWNKQILWPQKQEDRDEGGWNGLERQATWQQKGLDRRASRKQRKKQGFFGFGKRAGDRSRRPAATGDRGGSGGDEELRIGGL